VLLDKPRTDLHIDGIDVVRGLRLCAGNEVLYTDLLQKFLATLSALPVQLQGALAAGNLVEAERLVHSLKGVAANIGATKCSALSAHAEQVLNQAVELHQPLVEPHALTAPLLAHVVGLQVNLRQALAAVKPAALTAAASATAVDADLLRQVCRHLADLLDSNNAEAEMLLQAQADLLGAGLGDAFALLQRQVQDFDFSEASQTLTQAALAVHIHLD
jgi:two-component system sensor histidine kinase/response regulator